MPTVIDSLVLELGIDETQFTKAQRNALDGLRKFEDQSVRSGKTIESQGKRIDEFFVGLKRGALGVLAVFLGGREIKEFVNYVTTLDAATGRLSKTLDMSTRELSAWQSAAEQTGGSAETISGALQGITGDMNRFMLTGQGTLASVLRPLGISLFNNNQQLKTAGELMMELSDAVHGMDPARATAFLSMIPGMNAQTINLLLEGRRAIERYLQAARDAGGTTEESAKATAEYQRQLSLLDRNMTDVGRTILSGLLPGMNRFTEEMIKQIELFKQHPITKLKEWGSELGSWLLGATGSAAQIEMGISPPSDSSLNDAKKRLAAGLAGRSSAAPGSSAGSSAEMEAYIRSAAIARGIDPNVAVQVARSEGIGAYVGDRGSSFGPFQLHYGNVAGGGMAVSGLGDVFTKRTGLDARDPSTWKAQVDFALDEARKGGWGPWHGWRGLPSAGIGAIPQGASVAGASAAVAASSVNNRVSGDSNSNNSSTATTNVNGPITINSKATDAGGVASDLKAALGRASFAAQANYGLQ